jgi:hypothetical protein
MAPKQQLDFHPQLLVQMAKPETHLDAELMATSLENPPAEGIQSVSELVMRLAPATWRQPLPVMPPENSLGNAIQLRPEKVRREGANQHLPATSQENSLAPANRPLPEVDLDCRTEQRSVRMRLLAARARPQDLRLREAAARFPLPLALARQHSPGPGPCASSLKILVVRKCSRAARCDGRPIFARYRLQSTRPVPAGCDNTCSRSQRKHARPARPFPIAALDRYRCLPRPIAD